MRPHTASLAVLLALTSLTSVSPGQEPVPVIQPPAAEPAPTAPREQQKYPLTLEQLGIRFAVVSSKIRRSIIRTKTPYGFAVHEVVADSPAAKAGIAKGTIVLEVNGKPLRKVTELEAVLQKAKPGAKIELLCSMRKQKRRLLDRKPWVEKKVVVELAAAKKAKNEDGKKPAAKLAPKPAKKRTPDRGR